MKEKIIEIIRNACAVSETVTEDSELLTLSLDSLSFVGAVVEIEEAFGITFDLDEAQPLAWQTVGQIIQGVENKVYAGK